MTNHDNPDRRGTWPAVGPTEEDQLLEEQARARRQEVWIALGFLAIAAALVLVIWWCTNGEKPL